MEEVSKDAFPDLKAADMEAISAACTDKNEHTHVRMITNRFIVSLILRLVNKGA
jgi:hypothetical protein